MSEFIAALPMYDWPEVRAEVDAEWAAHRQSLAGQGIDAPQHLVRRNADMPAVPGGIRDATGAVIAPDPATLPPDELDFQALWKHPKLLLGQTCWGPMEEGLAAHVTVVGQPSYDGIDGGEGELYSSAILMTPRRNAPPSGLPAISPSRGEITGFDVAASSSQLEIGEDRGCMVISPLEGEMPGEAERGIQAPADGRPILPLDLMRGARFAFNGPDSMSGIVALTRDMAAMRESLDIFTERLVTGGHRNSIVAVAEGRADVCAVDCRSWALARRFEPAAGKVIVVGWTGRRKGLPYITSRHTPPSVVAILRRTLGYSS